MTRFRQDDLDAILDEWVDDSYYEPDFSPNPLGCPNRGVELCHLKVVRSVALDRGWADDQPTNAIRIPYEDAAPDWIPPLRRVPDPVDTATCLLCLDAMRSTDDLEQAWIAVYDGLNLRADQNWKPPQAAAPLAPGRVADRLPCLDCPDRPTTDRPRTRCPMTRPDTRRMVSTTERPDLGRRFSYHECERLCRAIGYPDGDAWMAWGVGLERAWAERDRREHRATREGREPGRVGRPQAEALAAGERAIAEAVQARIADGATRAAAVKAVAEARKCDPATVRKVLSRVAAKRARQKPVP